MTTHTDQGPFPPRPGDLDLDATATAMQGLMDKGHTVFVKWTCPGCGDRCIADEPNTIHTDGYHHGERADGTVCGTWYRELRFGLFAQLQVS